jgi:hypothetical protein
MKKLITFGAMFVAVFMFGSVAVAAAAPEWLDAGSPITATGGEAATIALPTGGSLLLEDMGVGIDVSCTKVVSSGTVGPKAADEVKVAEGVIANCKASLGTVEEVKGLHLPWVTELTLVEPKAGENLYRDIIKSGTGGEPGWLVKVSGTDDECTSEAGLPGFTDMTNEGNNVDTLFNSEAPNAKCTVGGAKEGLIEGLLVTSLVSGKALSVSG